MNSIEQIQTCEVLSFDVFKKRLNSYIEDQNIEYLELSKEVVSHVGST